MLKRNWSGIIERNLSFINEVSAGLGLVIGYILFGVYWLTTADTQVEVTTQKPVYEERIIGYLPEPQQLNGRDISELIREVPVTAQFPKLDDNGIPVTVEEVVTFTGKGAAQIIVENKEIVQPKLVSEEVKRVLQGQSNTPARFYLETILEGTGYYYADKHAKFDGVMSADIFAVRVGTLFASLAILLFLFRINAVPRLLRTLKDIFVPIEKEVFVSDGRLNDHYDHVAHFKRRLKDEQRVTNLTTDKENDTAEGEEFIAKSGKRTLLSLRKNVLAALPDMQAYLAQDEHPDRYVLCDEKEAYLVDIRSYGFDTVYKRCWIPKKVIYPLLVPDYSSLDVHVLRTYMNEHPKLRKVVPVPKYEAVKDLHRIFIKLNAKAEVRLIEIESQRKRRWYRKLFSRVTRWA